MEWLSVPSLGIGLIAAGLIYFIVKKYRAASESTDDSPDVSSNAAVHDGAPMPFLARGTLIVYLILLGTIVVYLVVALNAVELPEPTLLPEAGSSQLTATAPTQNQNAGKKPAAAVDKEIPVILEVFPSAALGSTPTLSLSLYGRNFDKDAVVRFNTRERTKKFVADDLLKVQLEPMDMVNVGALTVDVSTLETASQILLRFRS
jgi:hypothetical protein